MTGRERIFDESGRQDWPETVFGLATQRVYELVCAERRRFGEPVDRERGVGAPQGRRRVAADGGTDSVAYAPENTWIVVYECRPVHGDAEIDSAWTTEALALNRAAAIPGRRSWVRVYEVPLDSVGVAREIKRA